MFGDSEPNSKINMTSWLAYVFKTMSRVSLQGIILHMREWSNDSSRLESCLPMCRECLTAWGPCSRRKRSTSGRGGSCSPPSGVWRAHTQKKGSMSPVAPEDKHFICPNHCISWFQSTLANKFPIKSSNGRTVSVTSGLGQRAAASSSLCPRMSYCLFCE